MNRLIMSAAGLVAAASLAAIVGCTDMTAKVGGTVFLDDEPMELSKQQSGKVVFRPVSGGATCTGVIANGGAYTISTGATNSIAPGDYLISVRVVELVPPQGNNHKPSGKPITPAIYADPLTSGLSFTVKSGANRCDLKLESSAGPAVLPKPEPEVDPAAEEPAGEGTLDEEQPSPEEPVAEADAADPVVDTPEPSEGDASVSEPESETETAPKADLSSAEDAVEATVEETVDAP